MSDNPFDAPQSQAIPKVQQSPGALTVICVFCLILGIMGVLGSCMNGVALAAQGTLAKMIEDMPGDPSQKELQKIQMQAAGDTAIPNLVLAGINVIVGSLLVFGSIGGLRRKESGRGMLRIALLAAIIYSVLKIIVMIYTTITTTAALQSGLAENPALGGEAKAIADMTAYFSYGGLAFGVVISLAIMGFYIWSRGYLNKENVVQYFASAETAPKY